MSEMPLEFFYMPPGAISGDRAVIEGEEFVHLTHVMRKRSGEVIMVVDGAGMAYEAAIVDTAGRRAVCTLLASHSRLHERARAVHLGAAMLKKAASYDFLVEKCTELGVSSITPLLTTRTIPRQGRADRWQKLALAAMKQCGRCVLPPVSAPVPFETFLARAPERSLKIIPYEQATSGSIGGLLSGDVPEVTLCIGPEGGFTDEEFALAVEKEFREVTLGPARLRTETAAIVAVALAGL